MSCWKTGQIIKQGKYVIDKILGTGGAGITYRAIDTETNKKVAIKTLNATLQVHPDFSRHQERFIQEAFRLAKCSHTHVIRVDDVCEENLLWLMVMEYIDGSNLGTLARHQGGLSEIEAIRYIYQIGSALSYIHEQNILHRDVKPSNIMICRDRNQAILIDFGLARDFIEDRTQIHTNALTQGFAPIEQYSRSARRGAYTDVYALAATLYYVLTLQVPLPAQFRKQGISLVPPQQHNPYISDRTNLIILKGMELQPENRPSSVVEWLNLLTEDSLINLATVSKENKITSANPLLSVQDTSNSTQVDVNIDSLPNNEAMTDNTLHRISPSLKQALAEEFDDRYRLGTRISWEPFYGQWVKYIETEHPTPPTVRDILYKEKKTSCELRVIDGLCRLLLGCSYEQWNKNLSFSSNSPLKKKMVRRDELEEKTKQIINKSGSLLRIKSPASMGKSLFINNVLNKLNKQQYTIIKYDCLQTDQECLNNYNNFLQNFCFCLIEKLELPEELLSLSKWRKAISPNHNLTRYFEKIFFPQINKDLILVIKNFDLLLENETINTDICRLFRYWFGKARQGDQNSELWQKFHLVILHSTDVYAKLNINTSPLANVGKTIELTPFKLEEVQQLSQQYNLDLTSNDINKLMDFVAGHPLLIDLAFQYLNNNQNNLAASLNFIFDKATEETGIYGNHLRKLLGILQENNELKETFTTILSSPESLELNSPIQSWQLYSLGLVKRLDDNQFTVSCSLYKDYFSQNL